MFKKLTTYSLAVFMFGAGSVAIAHTGIKDAGMEGKTLYTAFTIGHGCGSTVNPTQLPVIAQSAVFPNSADAPAFQIGVDPDGTGSLLAPETATNLADHVVVATAGVSPLSFKGVQDGSFFKQASSTLDSLSVVRGLKFSQGKLDPTMVGLTSFRASGVSFVPGSCAKSLKVRIAVANWCKNNATNKAEPADIDRRADFWIGTATSKFSNPNVVELGYWPTLTINRDLTVNPLPASCNGVGYDVAVQPSAADIDMYLPMAGFPIGK